ncbi:hypothetical protein Baya_8602 [Bagarius yarrelli]|uniref:Secreted protein n=1 Tax=Bagarius yarrelli TaxID=175774 RepID=A0A556U4F1_BAGYA|nr:hypothetical protein Baya_8602 [Bagarius yarrelli]
MCQSSGWTAGLLWMFSWCVSKAALAERPSRNGALQKARGWCVFVQACRLGAKGDIGGTERRYQSISPGSVALEHQERNPDAKTSPNVLSGMLDEVELNGFKFSVSTFWKMEPSSKRPVQAVDRGCNLRRCSVPVMTDFH